MKWNKKSATEFVNNYNNKIHYWELRATLDTMKNLIKDWDKKSRVNKTAPLSFVWKTFDGWLEEKLKTNKPSDEIKRGRVSTKTGKIGLSYDEAVVRNLLWEFGGAYDMTILLLRGENNEDVRIELDKAKIK